MKNLTEQLKAKELKATPQRLAIYRYLLTTDKHPNCEVIFKNIQADYPTISLATVYKTVNTLKGAGLIQELNVCEDSFRYDARTEPHSHMICRKCENVYDLLDFELPSGIKREISVKTGFNAEKEQVYFYGVCGSCG